MKNFEPINYDNVWDEYYTYFNKWLLQEYNDGLILDMTNEDINILKNLIIISIPTWTDLSEAEWFEPTITLFDKSVNKKCYDMLINLPDVDIDENGNVLATGGGIDYFFTISKLLYNKLKKERLVVQ